MQANIFYFGNDNNIMYFNNSYNYWNHRPNIILFYDNVSLLVLTALQLLTTGVLYTGNIQQAASYRLSVMQTPPTLYRERREAL